MSEPVQKPHGSKQNYSTPDDFITAVKRRLSIDEFSHDFAAEVGNAKAASYFSAETDAFTFEHWEFWSLYGRPSAPMKPPSWGWLNPPFTDIGPWAKRCMEAGAAGGRIALLVPASVGSNWFRDYIDGRARVLFLNGRLAFMPDKPKWLFPKDCVLALYGLSITPGYEVWDWRRKAERKVA